MSGNAVKMAAGELRDRLLARAARHFAVEQDALEMAEEAVFVAGDRARSISLAELVRMCAAGGIQRNALAMFRAPTSGGLDPETGQGRVFTDFTYGAHAAEVAVDTETGEVTVLKSVGAHDVGQAINPAAVAGQIEGSALMGQGFALSEEMRFEDGRPVTQSLSEYLVPTAEDVPEIKAIILESRSGFGPYGAKGIGEPAYAPVAASIANAVADAIGVRIHDLPITPEKVVQALGQGREPTPAKEV
jgi:CO/xanthine dehydrogenase Mo-binding subunit